MQGLRDVIAQMVLMAAWCIVACLSGWACDLVSWVEDLRRGGTRRCDRRPGDDWLAGRWDGES